MRPLLVTGMARCGGSWLARMLVAGGGCVHINEPLNRRHPPGLSPGILRVPAPLSYQYVGAQNQADYGPGFADLLRLHYNVAAELRTNRSAYDLAKMIRYLTAFTVGRIRGSRPVIDDPYAVFCAEWLAERFDCQVVMLVRHPAGIVSSLQRIGTRWRDNLPDIAAQPELVTAYLSEFEVDVAGTSQAPFDVLEHACLLYRLIHSAIEQQAAKHPDFIIVRYEDLATDPLAEFEKLYDAVGLPFTARAQREIRDGCMAGPAGREHPWGRVGFSKTAFQPMDSRANAWAWRDRLTVEQVATVRERTEDVAGIFYTDAELAGEPGGINSVVG